jgi:hypothetical protein
VGVVLLLAGSASAHASGARQAHRDSIADPVPLSTPLGPERQVDGELLPPGADAELESKLDSAWGGVYTTSNGQQITMLVSDLYGVDEAVNQGLAEWISKNFFYGPELASAAFLVSTPAEIAAICGEDAAGCYSPSARALVVPGEHYANLHFMTVWAHEFGHHVAANRSNHPWRALEWGTKRWASHVGICRRVQEGTAFPGAFDGNYVRNPGEVFAESYARLVNRDGNWADNWWPVWDWLWDPTFTPDATSLGILQRDVLEPWEVGEALTWSGTLKRKIAWKVKWVVDKRTKKRRKTRKKIVGPVLPKTFVAATGYDGVLSASLHGPRGASLTATDRSTGAVLASGSTEVEHTVCGQRAVVLRVAARAAGAFTVSISKP